jgi:hypothetical protein
VQQNKIHTGMHCLLKAGWFKQFQYIQKQHFCASNLPPGFKVAIDAVVMLPCGKTRTYAVYSSISYGIKCASDTIGAA